VSIADGYDAILLDLDGVLYRGDQPIPAAASTVAALRRSGKRLVFLTNNSARTPAQVAAKLTRLGIEASPDEVVTSAGATADFLEGEADGDARTAYVIGQDGVRTALRDAGFEILDGDPSAAAFVVVGWDGDVSYDDLRRASVLVRGGARLVATNADASYPAPGGELWPGAGAILAAVETASGTRAIVIGKPHPPLFEAALARAGSRNALMVGDRMETDVAGAVAAGLDSCLVRSGASRPAELLDQDELPVAVLRDVGGLVSQNTVAKPRPATPEDLPAVRALTAAPDDAAAWGPDGVWVSSDRELDATATVHVRGEHAYVRAVATREDLRGQGLGTILVGATVRSARRGGAEHVWLLTETAEPFFRLLGFETVPRDSMPDWIEAGPGEGCPQTAVAMRRELPQ
jgi:HAD superfamily hydrolase (TIGR01457 family)